MTEKQGVKTEDNKNVSILQPKNDIVFQTLFSRGKESITKAILEDILKIEIEKLDLDKTKELLNDNQEDKNGRLDLRAVINDNIECDIELQLQVHKKAIERFLCYWSKVYSSNLKTGEKYTKLRKTISIVITGERIGSLKEIKKAHTKWQIREEDYKNIILTKDLELHIIELPKAIEEYKKNPKDEVLQWMMFLENPEDMEVKKIMENNEDIKEAKNELDKISMDEALRRRVLNQQIAEMDRKQFLDDAHEDGYNEGLEEGEAIGRASGITEGILEAKINMIEKLIKKDMSIKDIADITDIEEEDIINIINSKKINKPEGE